MGTMWQVCPEEIPVLPEWEKILNSCSFRTVNVWAGPSHPPDWLSSEDLVPNSKSLRSPPAGSESARCVGGVPQKRLRGELYCSRHRREWSIYPAPTVRQALREGSVQERYSRCHEEDEGCWEAEQDSKTRVTWDEAFSAPLMERASSMREMLLLDDRKRSRQSHGQG